MMDTLENFFIFRKTKLNNQINDKFMVKPNVIFETIFAMITVEGYVTHTPKRGNNRPQSYKIPFPVHTDIKAFQGNIQQVIHPYH